MHNLIFKKQKLEIQSLNEITKQQFFRRNAQSHEATIGIV